MQAGFLPDKVFNFLVPVNFAAIPQEYDMASQMPQEQAEELQNFHVRDVGGVETDMEAQAFASGGNGNAGYRGYFIPAVAMPKQRGLSHRSPCLTDVGNKKKPAFIEENEMGAKYLGFFLYAAICAFSSFRYIPRPFPKPAVPASANSTRGFLATGRYDRGRTGY
ncbi:MAG: hypothetical protein Q8N65_00450 [bacterium]|nr:hypothetical protein [bacterium]